MTVWAVFIHCAAQGYQSRWIDSLWAGEMRAYERQQQLDRMMSTSGFSVPAHRTTRMAMQVDDAEIREKDETPNSPRADSHSPDDPSKSGDPGL